jgi:uncharacterized protein (DUF2132 family)
MTMPNSKNPLHGVTLAMMIEQLVDHFGWEELAAIIPVRCFLFDPSIKSSLAFLRKTPWARSKVESLYLKFLEDTDSPEIAEKP